MKAADRKLAREGLDLAKDKARELWRILDCDIPDSGLSPSDRIEVEVLYRLARYVHMELMCLAARARHG